VVSHGRWKSYYGIEGRKRWQPVSATAARACASRRCRGPPPWRNVVLCRHGPRMGACRNPPAICRRHVRGGNTHNAASSARWRRRPNYRYTCSSFVRYDSSASGVMERWRQAAPATGLKEVTASARAVQAHAVTYSGIISKPTARRAIPSRQLMPGITRAEGCSRSHYVPLKTMRQRYVISADKGRQCKQQQQRLCCILERLFRYEAARWL